MKKYTFATIFALGFLFITLAGCDKFGFLNQQKSAPSKAGEVFVPVPKGPIVARVNGMPITLNDLEEEIAVYNDSVPADKPEMKITTREQKLDHLKNQMVRRVLLYQEALNRGLEREDDVARTLEKTKQELLVMKLARDEIEKVEPSSKEIEEYYNNYKDQLKEPEERQIREIMVSTEAEAKEIMILLLQGQDFTALAKERSKAPSSGNSGDLGFIKSGVKSAQFDAVAFADNLEVGKVSNIFKGTDGYYILKVEAKRGGKQKSLSEMWEDIKKGLTFLKQQQKIEELMGKLSAGAKKEIYEGEIK